MSRYGIFAENGGRRVWRPILAQLPVVPATDLLIHVSSRVRILPTKANHATNSQSPARTSGIGGTALRVLWRISPWKGTFSPTCHRYAMIRAAADDCNRFILRPSCRG